MVVQDGVVGIEVVGALYRLEHEQDFLATNENFEGEKMSFYFARSERLQWTKEVTRHLQRVRRLKEKQKLGNNIGLSKIPYLF